MHLNLKKKPARAAREGVNPFTKEPCVFKAKPVSKTMRRLVMMKLMEMLNLTAAPYVTLCQSTSAETIDDVKEMPARQVDADVVSYSLAMSAYEKGRQWAIRLALTAEMERTQ